MKIKQVDKGGLVILYVEGEIIGTWANKLNEILVELRREISYSNIVLDISKVSFVDSLGADVIKNGMKNGINVTTK